MRVLKVLGGVLGVTVVVLFVALASFAAYVYAGARAGATPPTGTLAAGVGAAVQIDRDTRGIPHIRAGNERDMFFGEGFAQGCDRLFQLDVYRRLVAGRLAEVFGSVALGSDEEARVFDVNGTVDREVEGLDARARDDLSGFAAGINAAMAACPFPPEFRAMGYRPEPWQTRDTLLVAFATVVNLADSWDDVLVREDVRRFGPAQVADAFFPVTDPAYDAPITSRAHAPVAPLPKLTLPFGSGAIQRAQHAELDASDRAGLGSNDFAAGAALTGTGRALLANDPHLQLRMPGIWYLVDIASPGYHAAGATLAGIPGVILGHNQHIAWGVTNGSVATTRIYRETFRSASSDEYRAGETWLRATHRREVFTVRFGKAVARDYLATRHGFVFADRGTTRFAAAWTALTDHRTGFATYDGLDRARDLPAALRALATYPGPPQNFVLADDRGNAAYHLAGDVWRDSTWALGALDGVREPPPSSSDYVAAALLPRVDPGRNALVFTANDRMYGAGYPYRLTSNFEAPYRAARISQLLHARSRYDVAAFSAIQADVLSLPERDLAHAAAAALRRFGARGVTRGDDEAETLLAAFDGRFVEGSRAATLAFALRRTASEDLVRYHMPPDLARRYLAGNAGPALVAILRLLRERPKGWVPGDLFDAFLVDATRRAYANVAVEGVVPAWGDTGARVAAHPFSAFGFKGWNGTQFPGHGDGFSPHVQASSVTQSFRAVWDVGDWDAGGIVIPQGESGEPASPHYRDGAPVWLSGRLVPLPFNAAAVAAARSATLTLVPVP